ncbi:MAG: Nif11-like leader peptide family natural product precursor [Deferribacterales bacterium]
MSVEKVKEFFKRLEDDEAFRDDFLKDETLEKDNYEAICKAAFVKGYEFTLEDFKAAKEEMKDIELNENQLAGISGGVSADSNKPVSYCQPFGIGGYSIYIPE